jgi:hypothetical protein
MHQSTGNSQSFVHTSQRLNMCPASHTADVETVIRHPKLCAVSLVTEGMAVPTAALTLAKTEAEAGQTLCLSRSPTRRSRTELSPVILVTICTTRLHSLLHNLSISGECECSDGSERQCRMWQHSNLSEDKVIRILFQLGRSCKVGMCR